MNNSLLHVCLLLWLFISAPLQNVAQPNILLIIADDLGVDFSNGYQDNQLKPFTPNLDALQRSGVTFKNAWAAPVCTPTRAAIMSGKYGSKTGVLGLPGNLDPENTSIFQQLDSISNNQYAKAVIGKWHISFPQDLEHPAQLGIDHYSGNFSGGIPDYYDWTKIINGVSMPTTTYATTETTSDAINWINEQDLSWMMWLAYNAPHTPFQLPPEDLFSINNTNSNRRTFVAMIEAMDTEIGRLLSNIPADELENTVIIYVGDNGTSRQVSQNFPADHGKSTPYQGGVHVPFIVSGAGVSRVNEWEDALVHVTDIYATIMELVGAELPGGIYNSLSFDHLLKNEAGPSRAYNYSEILVNNGHNWCIRDSRHKLIDFADGHQEFYDLLEDSLELNNIIEILPPELILLKAQLEAEAVTIQTGWSCQDFIKNGDEENIDCGGSLCAPCVTSISEAALASIEISPNPARNKLVIKSKDLDIDNIKIVDISGTPLITKNNLATQNHELNISTLTSGIYFLEIECKGQKLSHKFIKN